MLIYSIYKITNKTNGKSYIGFTNDCYRRWHAHQHIAKYNKRNTKFYAAIRKYGWDSFTKEVIYQSLDRDHALLMETKFITDYDSISNGYNHTTGGVQPVYQPGFNCGPKNGFYGKKQSDNAKERMREAWKNRTMTEEHKLKMAKARAASPLRSHPKSESMKAKLRKPKPPESIEKYRQSALSREKVTCPHCGKTGDTSNMARWHGDNCKILKPRDKIKCPHCDYVGASPNIYQFHFTNCKSIK